MLALKQLLPILALAFSFAEASPEPKAKKIHTVTHDYIMVPLAVTGTSETSLEVGHTATVTYTSSGNAAVWTFAASKSGTNLYAIAKGPATTTTILASRTGASVSTNAAEMARPGMVMGAVAGAVAVGAAML